MQWEGREESKNVEDRRGMGMGKPALAVGGLGGAIIVILGLIFGVDIQKFLGQGPGGEQPPGQTDPSEDKLGHFAKVIFGDTERIWDEQFKKMDPPRRYEKPKLVIFSESTNTGCGAADAGIGPFYCPADSSVYIDLSFYHVLEDKLGSPGEFARAYVLAHEVGHHVQRLLGYSARVDNARRTGSKAEANRMSVRLELQADYLAGVWAHHAQEKYKFLDRKDLEDAENAAYHIGDDYLQKQARGRVQPDSFTHGTSKQRQKWFLKGFQTGDVKAAAELFELPYGDL
ncbi:MAG TPA: neutral zinc metallopeptidase [Gemmataceae bacterium]|nr:neutral zinc metallopeptidase [Gemmataceae bacterium]